MLVHRLALSGRDLDDTRIAVGDLDRCIGRRRTRELRGRTGGHDSGNQQRRGER
jgi:hypothetical protein